MKVVCLRSQARGRGECPREKKRREGEGGRGREGDTTHLVFWFLLLWLKNWETRRGGGRWLTVFDLFIKLCNRP